MNAFLISAGVTTTQICPTPGRGGQMMNQLQTWDSCMRVIIYGGDGKQAQQRFKDWLSPAPDIEYPAQIQIKRVVAAQFVDQLFTESGSQVLDWPQIAQQIQDLLQNAAVDDFEQGYWVDINQTLPPGKVGASLESLKRDLPEDIRSGLNWSPDKQFFFLVSILRPRAMPTYPADEPDDAASAPDSTGNEALTGGRAALDESVAALAEMRDLAAVALVQARNSVVAAWLWRRHAADTPLARNEIHLAPCCDLIPAE